MEIYNFLNLAKNVTANTVTGNTATFNNINIESSVYMTNTYNTSIQNSLFFINGVNIYSSSILSMENSGANLLVTFDTASIGHSLDSTDTILVVGKFS